MSTRPCNFWLPSTIYLNSNQRFLKKTVFRLPSRIEGRSVNRHSYLATASVIRAAIMQEETEEEIEKRLTELVLERPLMSEACVRQEYNKRREWGEVGVVQVTQALSR